MNKYLQKTDRLKKYIQGLFNHIKQELINDPKFNFIGIQQLKMIHNDEKFYFSYNDNFMPYININLKDLQPFIQEESIKLHTPQPEVFLLLHEIAHLYTTEYYPIVSDHGEHFSVIFNHLINKFKPMGKPPYYYIPTIVPFK